jgi:lipooligosaccharide transport system permease protein
MALLTIPVGILTGLCFSTWIAAFSATQKTDNGFAVIFRFGLTPLFLFSGTFFPVERLPAFLQPVAFLTPTYHGVTLTRDLSLGIAEPGSSLVHLAFLVVVIAMGCWASLVTFRRALVH